MDENAIQDMRHILGSINPVVDNPLPPEQIHHHVTPELESNNPYSPTLETHLKLKLSASMDGLQLILSREDQ